MKLLYSVGLIALAFSTVVGLRALASCSTEECFETSCVTTSKDDAIEFKLTSAFNGYSTAGGGTRTEKTGKTAQRSGPNGGDECSNTAYGGTYHAGNNCGASGTWTEWGSDDHQLHYCKSDY